MSESAPRWSLDSLFQDLTTVDYTTAFGSCEDSIDALADRIDNLPEMTQDTVNVWAAVICEAEALGVEFGHLRCYVGCRNSAATDDEAARQESVAISALYARLSSLETKLETYLGTCSDPTFAMLLSHSSLGGLNYVLKRKRERAARRLPADMEQLVSELAVDGFHAWGRLYNDITGGMEFDLDGESTPLAWRRSLMQEPDSTTRHKSMTASNAALAEHGTVLASTLNSIAGTRITLQRWRGKGSVLEESIHSEGMEQETLDTMLDTVRAQRALPRAYFQTKARLLGRERISFADMGAPLSLADPVTFTWTEARRIVLDAFAQYHPDLAQFAQSMFDNNRIEAEPRRGKRSGAYCTSSKVEGSSRIFMTFRGMLGDVVTLAHELGHAYHNYLMTDMRGWSCRYPASLAETASILAETLVGDALLNDPGSSDSLRLQVLDKRLHSAAAYMLNIPMRFEFEKAFYGERVDGPLNADRLCTLMHDTQLSVYGPALDPAGTDPWFWASKLHFFLTHISFYNFPYTFGYLFSTGVLAEARRIGPREFHPRLVDLLRRTGSDKIENVAEAALGVDLGQRDFWHTSLMQVAADLDKFNVLVKEKWA